MKSIQTRNLEGVVGGTTLSMVAAGGRGGEGKGGEGREGGGEAGRGGEGRGGRKEYYLRWLTVSANEKPNIIGCG
jgi:hypothetical protein